MITEKKLCGAKTKSGIPCRRAPMGNGRCYRHGGATPSGPESPHFKHGSFSRYIPRGIRADFETAMANPNWLGLRENVATLVARLSEIGRKIDAQESVEAWKKAGEQAAEISRAVESYKEAARAKDPARMGQAFLGIEEKAEGLIQLVQNVRENADLWAEAYDVLERHRRMVESEARMRVELRQTITKERALILLTAMVEMFRQVVKKYCSPELARDILLETGSRVQKFLN